MTFGNGIELRVQEILEEPDPQRRLALSRQLRAELGDSLSDEAQALIRKSGLDIPTLKRGLREIK